MKTIKRNYSKRGKSKKELQIRIEIMEMMLTEVNKDSIDAKLIQREISVLKWVLEK